MGDTTKVKDRATTIESLKEADELTGSPLVVKPVAYPLETLVPEARQQTPAVGQRVTRPDGHLHGLGQTKYIDDMTFPNMIHAKILRSEHAHARVVNVNTSEAEKMPGVLATLTRV